MTIEDASASDARVFYSASHVTALDADGTVYPPVIDPRCLWRGHAWNTGLEPTAAIVVDLPAPALHDLQDLC